MASRKVNGTATVLEKHKEHGEQPGLELLLEATARLRGAPTPAELLRTALEAVQDTSSWKAGAAWVAEEGKLSSAVGELREGEGVPGRAWRQRDLYQAADLAPWRDDPRVLAAQRQGLEAWLALPVLRSGEVEAVLEFFAPDAADSATERVLRAFGRLVSERMHELRQQGEQSRQDDLLVDYRNQLRAIADVQAVIEFTMDGTVITANDNFLKTMGYKLEELQGQHHRLFCEPAYAASSDYALMWEKLRRGEGVAGRFPSVTRDGRVIWLRASYNTIADRNGKPAKVVKWATDITATVEVEQQAEVTRQEAARIRNMVENAPIAVMGCDLDLNITYMNACSSTTLGKLQQYLPCRVDEMVGKSIDIFHKHPEHQRKLLADPKNLPHKANIRVGPETLSLLVTATMDAEGRYVGPMLTWELITERQALLEREQQRQEQERREAEEMNAKVGSILNTVTANSQGDLTQAIEILSDDPVGRVGQGIARLVSDMRHSLGEIKETALTLGSASEQLTAVGRQMNAHSEASAQQATAASAAGEEVNHNIQTVAAATEEMTASIREIAKNAHQAARVSSNAVEVASATNQTIAKLGESSSEIGKVIKVISSIAQQTNLLALNATIEAARAGEAGRGFAVVANEVKELAKETAKATEDITQKIETIQSDSTGAVQAIAEITSIIHEISDIANTIAGAVEEQSATTSEISRNVSEAARGSSEISRAIAQVAQAADSSREGAEESLQACNSLATLAAQLQSLISRFKL